MDITRNEIEVLHLLGRTTKIDRIERRSLKEYDLHWSGAFVTVGKDDCTASGWLPLSIIRDFLPWSQEPFSDMTDFPVMAKEGDWSAVRDSSYETVWKLFDLALTWALAKANRTIRGVAK